MLGLTGIRLGTYAALCAAVIGVVGLGYWHYTTLVDDLATERARTATLQETVTQQRAIISKAVQVNEKWVQEAERTRQTLEELKVVQSDASAEARKLNDAFAKHNLQDLSTAKPGLIERRLNDGSDRALRLLEQATGAPGTGRR